MANDEKNFKEEEAIEISKMFGLVNNIEKYCMKIYSFEKEKKWIKNLD